MRRPLAAGVGLAAVALAALLPSTGTLAVFTDAAGLTGAPSTTFQIVPVAVGCTGTSATATLTWTAQQVPAGTTYLTQSTASTFGAAPAVVGATATRTASMAATTYGSGLARNESREVTVTVTATLATTSWTGTGSRAVRVSRNNGSTYSITCL